MKGHGDGGKQDGRRPENMSDERWNAAFKPRKKERWAPPPLPTQEESAKDQAE